MTGVLASVTSVEEARIALEAGADIVDLKNPSMGALGALPLNLIRQIVSFVDARKPVSATVGDLPMNPGTLYQAVTDTAATGADIVKVGLFGHDGQVECIQALTQASQQGIKIVAVMFADQQPDFSLVPILASAGFHGAMLDTAEKAAGGLRQWMGDTALRAFVTSCKAHGLLTGLAGALRMPDVQPLLVHNSDYLGFRGALCGGDRRESALDPERVSAICRSVAQMQHSEHRAVQQHCIA